MIVFISSVLGSPGPCISRFGGCFRWGDPSLISPVLGSPGPCISRFGGTTMLPLVEATAVDCGADRNDDDVACEACNVSMLSGGRCRRRNTVELCGPAVASDGVTSL
ncbi:hypothetical protein TNCT_61661 [Trichonephila clavata]|uniref:Uncharacterized protein n=1 Tax=Trichonephila clavata TaxID=2740835 RepID=A0A8X6LKB0_TRICU|nr:hypothetical protein TNCT_61661 [Trichonephila clavata]